MHDCQTIKRLNAAAVVKARKRKKPSNWAHSCLENATRELEASKLCRKAGRPVAALRCLVEVFGYLEAAETTLLKPCPHCKAGFVGDRCCRKCDGTGREGG